MRKVTFVLGTTAGGTGAHVRMLATALAARGIEVAVAGPAAAGARFSFPGVPFVPVEIGSRPRPGDLAVLARLRRLLLRPARPGPAAPGPGPGPGLTGIVHAHGMRAGALTVLALIGARGARRPGVVVTVHNAPPPGGGAAVLVYRLLELVVARGADLVLCVSPDLERRMRGAGARQVRRAVIAGPALRSPSGRAAGSAGSGNDLGPGPRPGDPLDPRGRSAAGRPVVLAAGRLAPQKGLGTLLDAAVAWRDLQPPPLVMIAGDGPLAGPLRERAAALGLDAAFLGQVADVPALLAAAAVFVLPSQWEGQPLVLQEALRAGTPVVAARVGGVPGLTGPDAALLIPPGDAAALADAVRSVLTDPPLAARLRAAAVRRAATLPGEDDAAAAVLSAYAALRPGRGLP